MLKAHLLLFPIFLIHSQLSGQQKDVEEINRLSEQFSQNYLKRNFRQMADIYTEDAVLCSPGRDHIVGRENIFNFWSNLSSTKYVLHKSTPEQVIISGNEAHDFGYFFTQTQNEDGTLAAIASSKYYIIWVRQADGSWKMKMDMWNSRDRNWNAK